MTRAFGVFPRFSLAVQDFACEVRYITDGR
jgi:hypothetical protein